MPASIFERVADELGLPPDRSEKLVRAMIREIRKRAHKGRGVKIPNLGAFSVENGALTFTPESSLARSVNQRFEGLGEERVALPEVDESATAGEGPTTITRGFDMGAWDPLDTGGDAPASGASESGTGTSSGADTDQFQAPDTDEFQAAPDTDEFTRPFDEEETQETPTARDENADGSAGRSEPAEAEPSSWDVGSAQPVSEAPGDGSGSDDQRKDTFSPSRSRSDQASADKEKEIDPTAPLAVDDHRAADTDADDPYGDAGFSIGSASSDEPSAEPSRTEPEEEEEPNIWASDSSWDFSTVSSADVEDEEGDEDDESGNAEVSFDEEDQEQPEYPSYRPPDADEQIEEESPSRSIFDFDEKGEEPKREAPKTTKLNAAEIEAMEDEPEEGSSSRTATIIFSTIALLLVLAGGWIVLGEKGIVPPPARVLGLSEGIAANEEPPASSSDGSQSAASDIGDPDEDAGSSGADTDASTAASSSSDSDRGASPSRSFNRGAGGYTIVVASRSTRSGAEAMVDQFRRNLSDTNLPVDIVTGTSGGETRYRVGVGQFDSRAEAIRMRDRMTNRLPDGAWPVAIN